MRKKKEKAWRPGDAVWIARADHYPGPIKIHIYKRVLEKEMLNVPGLWLIKDSYYTENERNFYKTLDDAKASIKIEVEENSG